MSQRKEPGKIRKKLNSFIDAISVAVTFLFPLIAGAVFFRLLGMAGVPGWYIVVQGVLFAGSLAQAVYFLAIGIIRALRKKNVPGK